MERNINGLLQSGKNRTAIALNKVNKAIDELLVNGNDVNFSTVSKLSGISANFIYKNDGLKKKIETIREKQVNNKINQRVKFDKTAKSKDIIIVTKDKKIAKLEEENLKLKTQIQNLQARLYKGI